MLGATGKTGRAVVAAALRRGLTVCGTTRDPRTPDGTLTWHRADVVTGDGLAGALTGADAAYLIVPNLHPAEVEAAARVVGQVATEVGVRRLVYHSVADPDDPRMMHHVRKGAAERVLRELRPETVVLRPCAYQQNLLAAALAGRLEVPYRLSVPFSLVDVHDVAEVAVPLQQWLAEPGAAVTGGFTTDPGPLTRLLGRPPTTWAQLLTKEAG